MKSAYEYDAFGNRTSLVEDAAKTSYTYDILDRLVEAKELNADQIIVKTYEYDKRGNQTKEYVDGLLQKTFTFDATNMLSKVVDTKKGELENHYNGLGFRVASNRPEEKIEYLCDLSRDYYNLLERTINGETESFIYDNNVVSMSKAGRNYYYLQDELGSPMYMTGTDGMTVSSYAFDDFGRNIDPLTGKQRNHDYATNGNIIQPFAFTGYQEDEVSGLKFAQARYYDAKTGRFQSEDNVKGFISSPFSLNHYGYCFGNPIELLDNDGNIPKWISNTGRTVKKAVNTVINKIGGAKITIEEAKTETGAQYSFTDEYGGSLFVWNSTPSDVYKAYSYSFNPSITIPFIDVKTGASITVSKDITQWSGSINCSKDYTDEKGKAVTASIGYQLNNEGFKKYISESASATIEGIESHGQTLLPDHRYKETIKVSEKKELSDKAKVAIATGAIIASTVVFVLTIVDDATGVGVADEPLAGGALVVIEEEAGEISEILSPYWNSFMEKILSFGILDTMPPCSQ